ncbi:MAG: aspartate carbamoyltransferase catalytic subunit [Parvibaculales bacterium]
MTKEVLQSIDFPHKHLLGIEALSANDITILLDLADKYVEQNRRADKKCDLLRGRTQINLFFEPSTRTQSSFELAGKRLGADVMNMHLSSSAIHKGETLIDTAATLNALNPDLLVVRHGASGALDLLSKKVSCATLNAGDGMHEHPTQALLDALTIRRRIGRIEGLRIAICGDVLHSRVARSNILLLQMMGASLHLIGPSTLLPSYTTRLGVKIFTDIREGLKGCDVVMALRIQKERMTGSFLPSIREYYHLYGLDHEKLTYAKKNALVMHPGPMNRGIEINSLVADDPNISLIHKQVEMGVAVRMATLHALAQSRGNKA